MKKAPIAIALVLVFGLFAAALSSYASNRAKPYNGHDRQCYHREPD